ncbi:hypothetical protein PGB90_009869 [Kerria lacca]
MHTKVSNKIFSNVNGKMQELLFHPHSKSVFITVNSNCLLEQNVKRRSSSVFRQS